MKTAATPILLPSRRALLSGAAGALVLGILPAGAAAHPLLGRVKPPVPTPLLHVVDTDGRKTELANLLRGKISAVQLMFTTCSATCPIQGALFSELQQRMQKEKSPPHLQLLSVSIDPLGDDARALRTWLQRFDASSARWSAATIAPNDLEPLYDFTRGKAQGPDRHTAIVYLFDRDARLVYRTTDFPPAGAVLGLMQDIDRLG